VNHLGQLLLDKHGCCPASSRTPSKAWQASGGGASSITCPARPCLAGLALQRSVQCLAGLALQELLCKSCLAGLILQELPGRTGLAGPVLQERPCRPCEATDCTGISGQLAAVSSTSSCTVQAGTCRAPASVTWVMTGFALRVLCCPAAQCASSTCLQPPTCLAKSTLMICRAERNYDRWRAYGEAPVPAMQAMG